MGALERHRGDRLVREPATTQGRRQGQPHEAVAAGTPLTTATGVVVLAAGGRGTRRARSTCRPTRRPCPVVGATHPADPAWIVEAEDGLGAQPVGPLPPRGARVRRTRRSDFGHGPPGAPGPGPPAWPLRTCSCEPPRIAGARSTRPTSWRSSGPAPSPSTGSCRSEGRQPPGDQRNTDEGSAAA